MPAGTLVLVRMAVRRSARRTPTSAIDSRGSSTMTSRPPAGSSPRRAAASSARWCSVDEGSKMKGQARARHHPHRHRGRRPRGRDHDPAGGGEGREGHGRQEDARRSRARRRDRRASPTGAKARRSGPGSVSRAGGVATAASSQDAGERGRAVGSVVHRLRAVRGADGDPGGASTEPMESCQGPRRFGPMKTRSIDGPGAGVAHRPSRCRNRLGPRLPAGLQEKLAAAKAAAAQNQLGPARPTPGSRRPSSASRARSRTRSSTPAATGPTARSRRRRSATRRLPPEKKPRPAGKGHREEEGRDEGGAAGRDRPRGPIRAAGSRPDPGRDRRGEGFDGPSRAGSGGAQVLRLREGRGRADAHPRPGGSRPSGR